MSTQPHPMRQRWENAQELMGKQKIDALLVTEKYNYWILTGHRSGQFDAKQRPMIIIIPREGDPTMVVYGRDERMVRAQVPVENVETYVDVPFPLELLPKTLAKMGLSNATIGCELGEFQRLGISYNDFLSVKQSMPSAHFVDASNIFNRIRMIKAPWEIERIRKACEITTDAWASVLAQTGIGSDSREVGKLLRIEMLKRDANVGHVTLGLEGAAYQRNYQDGDWLWCDFGAEYQGYHCDIARMAHFGAPTDEEREDFEKIKILTENLIKRIRPGISTSELTRQTNEDMEALGLPPLVGQKRVGHGYGVVPDPPSISLADDTVLEEGMVLTPEPRFFVPSGQRMHLEEMVVVTREGFEQLSFGAYELVTLP